MQKEGNIPELEFQLLQERYFSRLQQLYPLSLMDVQHNNPWPQILQLICRIMDFPNQPQHISHYARLFVEISQHPCNCCSKQY